LEFDDDILGVEYESFSCRLNEDESLDVGFYVEYESFSFGLVSVDDLFDPSKSTFTESKTFVPMIADLDQTLGHIERKRLVYLEPTILRRQHVRDNKICRPLTHLLVNVRYLSLFDV